MSRLTLRIRRATVLFGLSAGLTACEWAAASTSVAEDRVHALATELRCPVCQNQNLADSNADLARDLRDEIQRQVAAGQTDAQIRHFMVERYGQYVLYDPPVAVHTGLLWAAPALLLLGVGAVVWRRVGARLPTGEPPP